MNPLIIKLFNVPVGLNVFNAGLILGLMAAPIMTTIAEDALKAVGVSVDRWQLARCMARRVVRRVGLQGRFAVPDLVLGEDPAGDRAGAAADRSDLDSETREVAQVLGGDVGADEDPERLVVQGRDAREPGGLAALFNVLLAPLDKFARTLNEVPGKLVRTVAAVRDAK